MNLLTIDNQMYVVLDVGDGRRVVIWVGRRRRRYRGRLFGVRFVCHIGSRKSSGVEEVEH